MYSLSDVQLYIHTKPDGLSGACVWQYVQPKAVQSIYRAAAVGTTWRLQAGSADSEATQAGRLGKRTKTQTQVCTSAVIIHELLVCLSERVLIDYKAQHSRPVSMCIICKVSSYAFLLATRQPHHCTGQSGYPSHKWTSRLQLIMRCSLQRRVSIQSNGHRFSQTICFLDNNR